MKVYVLCMQMNVCIGGKAMKKIEMSTTSAQRTSKLRR